MLQIMASKRNNPLRVPINGQLLVTADWRREEFIARDQERCSQTLYGLLCRCFRHITTCRYSTNSRCHCRA